MTLCARGESNLLVCVKMHRHSYQNCTVLFEMRRHSRHTRVDALALTIPPTDRQNDTDGHGVDTRTLCMQHTCVSLPATRVDSKIFSIGLVTCE